MGGQEEMIPCLEHNGLLSLDLQSRRANREHDPLVLVLIILKRKMRTAKIPESPAPQRIALQQLVTQIVHRGAMGFRCESRPWSKYGVSIFLFRIIPLPVGSRTATRDDALQEQSRAGQQLLHDFTGSAVRIHGLKQVGRCDHGGGDSITLRRTLLNPEVTHGHPLCRVEPLNLTPGPIDT